MKRQGKTVNMDGGADVEINEFEVGAVDVANIKCLEVSLPLFRQDEKVEGGNVVADPKLDAVGLDTFTSKDGKKIGEPVTLAVQERSVGASWTSGCVMLNMIGNGVDSQIDLDASSIVPSSNG